MLLTVRPIAEDQKKTYEEFLALPENFAHLTFYHTWEWGELMRAKALSFERIGLYDGETLVAVGQFALQKLKLGAFWYGPRGLVLDYENLALVTGAHMAIKEYFHGRRGAAFMRVDPDVVRGDAAEAAIDAIRPKRAYIFTQAERVWMVDLQTDEASLLTWMKEHRLRKNVAYYFRRAARDGVTVRASDKPEDLEILIKMLHEMSDRKGGIGMHPDDHYRRQFAALAPKGIQRVFVAELNGEVLATALIAIYGKEASYLHGASSSTQPQVSGPHYLLFEAMKYIQANYPEVQRFNFWGIVSDKNRTDTHPRHGYSQFKRSFGGYKVHYIRSRDFVYSPLVWWVARQIDRYRTIRYKND